MVMDKPIATTQSDAVAIVEAVDRAGILAIVNFSQRFGWQAFVTKAGHTRRSLRDAVLC